MILSVNVTYKIIFVLTIFIIFALMVFFKFNSKNQKQDNKAIIEGAIFAAFAVVLNLIIKLIPFVHLAQGGSISISMVPLLIYSLRRGVKWGIIAGLIYAMIDLIIDFSIYHPLSIFLDYFFAYGAIGLAGLFSEKIKSPKLKGYIYIIIACLVGYFGRYFFSCLSGAVLFSEYAPENMNPWLYSLGYNLAYMGPSFILCTILTCLSKPIINIYK